MVLENGVIECYEFLKMQLKYLNKSSLYGKILLNIQLILKKLLSQANTYIIYLKHKRDISHRRKSFNFTDSTDEFMPNRVGCIE
jgi:hypothetical protein